MDRVATEVAKPPIAGGDLPSFDELLASGSFHDRLKRARALREKALAEAAEADDFILNTSRKPWERGAKAAETDDRLIAALAASVGAAASAPGPAAASAPPAAAGAAAPSNVMHLRPAQPRAPDRAPASLPGPVVEPAVAPAPRFRILPSVSTGAERADADPPKRRILMVEGGFVIGLAIGIAVAFGMPRLIAPGPKPSGAGPDAIALAPAAGLPAAATVAEQPAAAAPALPAARRAAVPVARTPVAASPVAASPVAAASVALLAAPDAGSAAVTFVAPAMVPAPPRPGLPVLARIGGTDAVPSSGTLLPARAAILMALPAVPGAPDAAAGTAPRVPAALTARNDPAASGPGLVPAETRDAAPATALARTPVTLPGLADRIRGFEQAPPVEVAAAVRAAVSPALPDAPRPAVAPVALPDAAAPEAAPGPQDLPPALGALFPGPVVLNAPASLDEAALAGLVESLAGTGFALATPNRVNLTISKTNVRFFHPEDAAAAQAVAATLGATPRDFSSFSPAPPAGTIEVWLAGRANGTAATPGKKRRAEGQRSETAAERELDALRSRILQQLRNGDHL